MQTTLCRGKPANSITHLPASIFRPFHICQYDVAVFYTSLENNTTQQVHKSRNKHTNATKHALSPSDCTKHHVFAILSANSGTSFSKSSKTSVPSSEFFMSPMYSALI
eukprot:Lankesteria_metandrocarpae@DN5208_c0_g1_i4.p1